MTYEEAIGYINDSIRLIELGEESYIDIDVLEVCLGALEKQIPKKRKMIDNVLYCSSCESYHGRYGDIRIPVGSKYCPYCGQAIDWSEEDD